MASSGFALGRYSTSLMAKHALRPTSDYCQHFCQLQRRVPAFCFGRLPQFVQQKSKSIPSKVKQIDSRQSPRPIATMHAETTQARCES